MPRHQNEVEVRLGTRSVRLTNLRKVFFPEIGLTKRDLLQYYADGAGVLVPHLLDRAMVMKRYPNGAAGEFFFMKRDAWGRTLASLYSVRPQPRATVSAPVNWAEVEKGVVIEDFRLDNVPARLRRIGDLWAPLLEPRGRYRVAGR